MRVAYKKMQEGRTQDGPLSQDQIRKLEVLSFKLSRKNTPVFQKRLAEHDAVKLVVAVCVYRA